MVIVTQERSASTKTRDDLPNVPDISPNHLFIDHTYIDERWARAFEKHCVPQGFIPFIDWDESLKAFVWHSMHCPDGTMSKKAIADKFTPEREGRRQEKDVEEEVFNALLARGEAAQRQVRCSSGIADIVTPTAIYEIKKRLARSVFFSALGQIICYREDIDPSKAAYIVADEVHVSSTMISAAARAGVVVLKWNGRDL